jgi:hypothetical protein
MIVIEVFVFYYVKGVGLVKERGVRGTFLVNCIFKNIKEDGCMYFVITIFGLFGSIN